MVTYIRAFSGEELTNFAPRQPSRAKKVLGRAAGGVPLVYVLVEGGEKTEFRRLSLFTKLPPLHLIPLYGDRNKRSKLKPTDSRRLDVIARQLAGGLDDLAR